MNRPLRRLVIGGAVAGVLGVAAAAFVQSGAVAVTEVRVVGARRVDPSAIRDASGIEVGANALTLDLAGAERKVEALPLVDDARVKRDGALGVVIVVAERAPVLAVVSSEGTVLVDRDGVPMQGGTRPDDLPRLLLAQGGVPDPDVVRGALRILESLRAGERAGRLVHGPVHGFTIQLGKNEIRLGDATGIRAKLDAWRAVRASIQGAARIDVRQPPYVAVAR